MWLDRLSLELMNPEIRQEINIRGDETILPTKNKIFQDLNLAKYIGNRIEPKEMSEGITESSNNRIINTLSKYKFAGDFSDVVQGGLVGSAVGTGLGLLSLAALRKGGISKLTGAVTKNPFLKGIGSDFLDSVAVDSDLHKSIKKKLALHSAIVGGGAGAAAGLLSKKRDYDAYYNEDPEMSKYGSEQHAFITETGAEPISQLHLPEDIKDAVNLAHPTYKYVPISTAATAIALANIARKARGGELMSIADSLSLGFPSIVAGSLIRKELDRRASADYMDSFSRQIDNKYKSANEPVQEFITDTGVTVLDPRVGPKNIEARIYHAHPYIEELPAMGSLVGSLFARSIGKGAGGVIAGGALGSTGASISKMLLMEHEMDKYRDKYIEEVNNKYLDKTANIVGKTFGVVNKLVNENPIGELVNNYVLANDLGKPVYNFIKKKNIGGMGDNLEHLETQAKNFMNNNPKVGENLKKVHNKVMNFGNKVQIPVSMGQMALGVTGLGGSKEIDQAQRVSGMQNKIINSTKSKYVGNLKGM